MDPNQRLSTAERAKTGDEAALGELLESHPPYLVAIACARPLNLRNVLRAAASY